MCRVGLAPVGEDGGRAPLSLNMPEGWLGQALDGGAIAPLPRPWTCVEALNDPALW